jgi:hypothetical protein
MGAQMVNAMGGDRELVEWDFLEGKFKKAN